MNPASVCRGIVLLALGTSALPAAPLNYNEFISGDLGVSPNSPVFLDFDVGVNRIQGSMGQVFLGPLDADFFTFTLEPNEYLTSIFVRSIDVGGNFYAIQQGTSISSASGEDHLGNTLVNEVGELTDNLQFHPYAGPIGEFVAPLGPGSYTVWYQELSNVVNYTFEYTVVSIPEPSAYAVMAGFGALGLAAMRRRSFHRK